MRIALATTEFLTEKTYDGGLSNYIYRLCLSLKVLGHEPIVFVASSKDESIIYKGITVIKINERHYTWWYWLINLLTFFRLNPALLYIVRSVYFKKIILNFHKTQPIDIIQYTNLKALGLFRPKHIPCTIRISSYQQLIDQASDRKQTFRLWQKQFLQDWMLKKSKNIFGPSIIIGNHIAQQLTKTITTIETPFTLDHAILDNSLFDLILQKTNHQPYLLYFGSLYPLKGVLEIAEILNEFFEKYPTHYFVFIGKDLGLNGKPIVQHLRAKSGHHQNRILWFDSIPHIQLYPVIQAADLVVLPSRIDNFPNTCIEAMAFGKVVIGTCKTSFEQLIDHEISGLLCEPKNAKSLLNCIEHGLKLDKTQKETMGQQAIKRIALLKPEIVVAQLVEYYQGIINSQNPPLNP